MTNEIHNCRECRYFLPTGDTHYNKPCGYCGNYRVQSRRVSDAAACPRFEKDGKASERKPP